MADEIEEKVTAVKDGKEREVRPTVAGAVRAMRARMPSVRPNGIFRHPDDWTEEEMNFIVDCLKQHIPLYTIANMVHCERHTLGKLVEKTPYLKELMENKYDDMLEELEYQFDKAVKGGNTALIIHGLNTLGRRRGGVWSTADQQESGGEEESRIVMGLIPDEEVAKAEEEVKRVREEGEKEMQKGGVDPMQMAIVQETVKEEVAKQVEAMKPEAIEADAVEVSSPPYDEGGGNPEEGYGTIGGGYQQNGGEDPWASGADSMFFQ